MKKLLITLFYADNLHGGVKYSAELGAYFYSLGYDVYCVGVQTSEFAKTYFEKNHVKLINIKNFDCAQYFDLVWAHHFPILPYLVRFGLKYKKLINSCISDFLLIEKPIFSYNNTDLILTLTDKTRNVFIKEYGIPADKIKILPNAAPDIFFENPRTAYNKLHNIAIVSNHPPLKLNWRPKFLENTV